MTKMTKNGLNPVFWWYFTIVSGFNLVETVLEQNEKNCCEGAILPPSVGCERMSVNPAPDPTLS